MFGLLDGCGRQGVRSTRGASFEWRTSKARPMNKNMRFAAASICLVLPLFSAACDKPAPTASQESVAATATATATATETATAAATATATEAGAAAEAVKVEPKRVAPRVEAKSPAPDPSSAPSASPSTEVVADAASDLAKKLDAVFKDAKTYRARFEQTYSIPAQGVEKRSSGIVLVSRPGKLAFVYDQPNANRLASDGKELHIYDAGNQQDIVTPVAKAQLPGAFGFLMGQGVSDAFHFELNPKAKSGEALLLGRPVEATPNYERVQFTIDSVLLAKNDVGALRGVLILDAQKNKNRFVFSDGAIPGAIDEKAFSFTPPPGTNVKRM
jgi:outer membrane lipoprotein carrier protein